MTYISIISIFLGIFLIDYPGLKKDKDLNEKIVYGILFSVGLAYALLINSGLVKNSLPYLVLQAVSFFRGIKIPPAFH